MTVLRVLLVVCVLVMVGASADASASSTATGTWTLNVTFAGTGTGLITSAPAGIVCTDVPGLNPSHSPQGTCSAQFPDGVSPWVIATPSGPISKFTDISGACSPDKHGGVLDTCQASPGPDGVGTAQVTFTVKPLPCSTSNVQTLPLSTARRFLANDRCKVGKITYAYAAHLTKGYVISQDPKAFWQRANGAVNLVVSKGRR
jgi:hypothetical protein